MLAAVISEVPDNQKPCHHKASGIYKGSYVRVGDGNRQMTEYEVNSILENRGQPKHDIAIVDGVKIDDLNSSNLNEFVSRVKTRRPKLGALEDLEILQSMGVIDNNKNITLAGVLCFTSYPQRWVPGLTITFVHYPGDNAEELGPNGERLLDEQRFDGPLTEALNEAYSTIVRAMRNRHLIDGLNRKEIPEYPTDAIREALVNAAVHRDLSNMALGSQIQIQLYNSRLEIRNPGGLYGPVTEENIGQPGVQAARNKFLIQILEELGPAENRGLGILTMFRSFRDLKMSPPKLEDKRTYFRVTFKNASMLDEETLKWLNQNFKNIDISENQRIALAFVYNEKEITNNQYCGLLGVTSAQAREGLGDLVSLKLLQRSGNHRWTSYHLPDSEFHVADSAHIPESTVSKKVAERHQAIEDYLSSKKKASPKKISEDLSIARRTLTNDLKRMVEDKRIKPTSASRRDSNTEYEVF